MALLMTFPLQSLPRSPLAAHAATRRGVRLRPASGGRGWWPAGRARAPGLPAAPRARTSRRPAASPRTRRPPGRGRPEPPWRGSRAAAPRGVARRAGPRRSVTRPPRWRLCSDSLFERTAAWGCGDRDARTRAVCLYCCYSTVIQTARVVKAGARAHCSQGAASCLFSKTLNVVGDVVDVATDHLAALFAEHAEAHPDREFLVFGSRRMSYAQVQRDALALADALGGLGVQPGDRLAVDLPNWPEWVVAFLAAAARGAVLVPLDPSLSIHELKYQLRHAEVRAAVVAESYDGVDYLELYHGLLPELPELHALVTVGAPDRWLDDRVYRYADLVSRVPPDAAGVSDAGDATQPLAILFTSGTMGKPKGVALSHRNVVLTARASGEAVAHTGDDRVLGAVPLFTIFGVHVVAVTITAGATLVLQERFDAPRTLDLIRRERLTLVHGVPTMFELLMRDPSFEEQPLTTCRSGLVAGSPGSRDLAARIRLWCDVQIAYGLTETGPTVTITRLSDLPELLTQTVVWSITGDEVHD